MKAGFESRAAAALADRFCDEAGYALLNQVPHGTGKKLRSDVAGKTGV